MRPCLRIRLPSTNLCHLFSRSWAANLTMKSSSLTSAIFFFTVDVKDKLYIVQYTDDIQFSHFCSSKLYERKWSMWMAVYSPGIVKCRRRKLIYQRKHYIFLHKRIQQTTHTGAPRYFHCAYDQEQVPNRENFVLRQNFKQAIKLVMNTIFRNLKCCSKHLVCPILKIPTVLLI